MGDIGGCEKKIESGPLIRGVNVRSNLDKIAQQNNGKANAHRCCDEVDQTSYLYSDCRIAHCVGIVPGVFKKTLYIICNKLDTSH